MNVKRSTLIWGFIGIGLVNIGLLFLVVWGVAKIVRAVFS